MSPSELLLSNLDRAQLAVLAEHDRIPGEAIERLYRECVVTYRKIFACFDTDTSLMMAETSIIRLKPNNPIEAALVVETVRLNMSEHTECDPGFFVDAHFDVYKRSDESVALHLYRRNEAFGTPYGNDDPGCLLPGFVYDPETEDRFDWSDNYNYAFAAGKLVPMIYAAKNTQAWIVESLLDRDLNPDHYEKALELFGQVPA